MTRRGQLVLLAAAALAVALVPMAVAYLQLGYHDDVQAATVDDDPLLDAERTLQRVLDDVSAPIPSQYAWSNRTGAVTRVRDRLGSTLATLNTSRLEAGTAISLSYNETRAREWAQRHCPDGPARQFGACLADRGVVVQERAGDTHVLGAAFDIRVTTDSRDWDAVTVVGTASSPEA